MIPIASAERSHGVQLPQHRPPWPACCTHVAQSRLCCRIRRRHSSHPNSLILKQQFTPPDNARLAHLCGPLDENLRQIEIAFDIVIRHREQRFTLEGTRARSAQALLQALWLRADKALGLDDIQLELTQAAQGLEPNLQAAADEPVLQTRRPNLHGRTPRQTEYIRSILGHDLTVGLGPAGTGKTFLAVACAVDALERNAVERLVLTRPAVEAGERLGFLPGDLAQKIDPYLRPLYDALYDLLGFESTQKLFERGTIEIAPLAFMRGRTLNNAFIILDEAQNTTPEQMKMFLTRIGFGSRAVITGDLSQVDLPRGAVSGLTQAERILHDVRGVAITRFTTVDVVRHPLVARIVEAYERAESQAQGGAAAAAKPAPRKPAPGAKRPKSVLSAN
ncbi:MAG: PhoH family protein [Betaproteobacteria bacterium]|nr:PhoH family protein [Betaproteobacteria bacterium]MDE2123834.1 PhoH family protein [Betaproteobacteria bacterium]MDE2187687.1 PhoH family protein [Betaproteobacteria bacterium]MDE2326016.1 PhoH family protein [Betaproteobacteria bacterium]